MAIIIGPGISVGRGISVGIGEPYAEPAMRLLLSESGKTSFDFASANDFFQVSQTDYNAVVSGLSSVTKYVLNDTFVAEDNQGQSINPNFAVSYPSDIATIPSGVYLFGFICRTTSSGTATPLISTTYRGTYTSIASPVTTSSSELRSYFLRKSSVATEATSYVGIIFADSGAKITTTTFNYAYDGSSPYSTWTPFTYGIPIFQMLGTPTKQW